ncbi:hypothetical protein V7S43_007812 [Phytophthora oleae]|uniref:Uncharacterized protein n=1 Tax=Phytophthora oleae TaxID=2107226 RepID=A0ABD3FJE0_9STRA
MEAGSRAREGDARPEGPMGCRQEACAESLKPQSSTKDRHARDPGAEQEDSLEVGRCDRAEDPTEEESRGGRGQYRICGLRERPSSEFAA